MKLDCLVLLLVIYTVKPKTARQGTEKMTFRKLVAAYWYYENDHL